MEPPLEPPDPPPECQWCEGDREVAVHSVIDCGGNIHDLRADLDPNRDQIKCPRGHGSGDEPEPDPLDDPRIP